MRASDIIAKKRDGQPLTREEIRFIVRSYTRGGVEDYQMSALMMAIYFRGMNAEETFALTEEMMRSGAVLDFSDLGRPAIDKHSTGGVGDKTSLIIAPVVASAGVLVPMISGRALAHSGGTLDKLESIPGFRTNLSLEEFRATLDRVGTALIGQTREIAPADRKLYALRDVTATVECRPLIAASVMSKKMAEGIDGVVLDVKYGSGAFMKTESEAIELAELMLDVARKMDRRCIALMTDMNQPLGRAVGNSLETIEAIETLKGAGPPDLTFLCRELSAHMILMGGRARDIESAREIYDDSISSGAGLNKMREIIRAQEGNEEVLENYSLFPTAQHNEDVTCSRQGYLQRIDTEAVGRSCMLLGAGRTRVDGPIDLSVGLEMHVRLGDRVDPGSKLATIYYNDRERLELALPILKTSFTIGDESVEPPPLIARILR